MKRLVRPGIDPLPRSLSTKSLAFLVVMLLSGIGISVHEFLESRRAPGRASEPSVQCLPSVLQECTRGEVRPPQASKPAADSRAPDPSASTGARILTPTPRPAASNPASAPTGWMPENDTATGPSGSRTNAVSER